MTLLTGGNLYNKYESRNPIERYLVGNFSRQILGAVEATGAANVHDVGCGEGHFSLALARRGLCVRATDRSQVIIDEARAAAKREGLQVQFDAVDISFLKESDAAEVILCCEVLEHLERPREALQTLVRLAQPYLVASVPREPLWSAMNVCRGKYLRSWGNTPGHVNRWSRGAFVRLLQEQFDVLDVKSPIPWTIALCRSRKNQGVHAAR